MTPFRLKFFPLFALLALTTPLFADGDQRPSKPEEKAAIINAHKAFTEALPKAPEGWNIVDQTQPPTGESVSPGIESAPMQYDFFIHWKELRKIESNELKKTAAGLNAMADPKIQDQLHGLQAKMMELTQKMTDPVNKGDNNEIQRIQAEMEKLSTEADQSNKTIDLTMQKAVAPEDRDVEARVEIRANAAYESFPGAFKREFDFQGHKAVRFEPEGDNPDELGTTLVFLGKGWAVNKDENRVTRESAVDSTMPYTQVQSVVIAVNGRETRAAGLLAGINLKPLLGLIQAK